MRETTDDREFDSRFDAAFQPGFDDSFEAGFGPVPVGAVEPRGSEAVDARPTPRRVVNRFVVALWGIGLGLIVLGLLGITGTIVGYGRSATGPTPDFVVALVLAQLSPWLVAIGLATLIGTLFLLATRWEHRP